VTLTAKEVAEITRLLEESSFDELYLELDGLKLSLKRGGAVGTGHASAPTPAPAPTVPAAVPTASAAQDIPAPLLGTFFRSPKPGAPPFVEVGSPVEEDTIIAIIEVMKLMNTVRAGVRGTVTEILARDGALVEYGQTLMRVNKAITHG
jgi:acetyl-CoA carboxylase biotin carboxyl carrier protein